MEGNLLIPVAKMFGTLVIGEGERCVLDLKGLDEPLHFINPKDQGTKYGDQYLQGDGTDILILNGVSRAQELMLNKYLYQFEQRYHKKPEEMNTQEVRDLLNWLAENDFNDRYCSDALHKAQTYQHVRGFVYRKLIQPVKAVKLLKGQTFFDGQKTQQATKDGALFVLNNRNIGHITNVPERYQTTEPNAEIIPYKTALFKYVQMQKNLRLQKEA